VLEARAICETCGHTRDWHDRDAERARVRSDPPVERPCYREVGGAPCRCNGFRESGTLVVPAGSLSMRGPATGFGMARVGAVALLLVVLGLGLLYAYRSQTPSVPEIDINQALQDINAGRVRAITIAGSAATLEFRDSPSHQERTAVPQPDTVLSPSVAAYNAAHPSQPIELRVESGAQGGAVGAIVLSLLPVLLIGGFFYYLIGARRRSQ
jgi:hypothetical protein